MRTRVRRFIIGSALLAGVGCHNEPDCPDLALPAGVELEVTLTSTDMDEGCEGLGASLDDSPIRFTTAEPVDVGAHNECFKGTLQPPDADELYGVKIAFCSPYRNGFTCDGTALACPGQPSWLNAGTYFGELPAPGSESSGLFEVEVSAEPVGDCPRVLCRQQFQAITRRL